jgi:hypothetical protein
VGELSDPFLYPTVHRVYYYDRLSSFGAAVVLGVWPLLGERLRPSRFRSVPSASSTSMVMLLDPWAHSASHNSGEGTGRRTPPACSAGHGVH